MEDVGRIDLEVKLLKTYFALKLYPQAVDLLKRAIYEHPRNNRLPLILSSLLVQENRYDEAIRQIEAILRTHPEDPRLLSFLGSVYEKSLHFTRAIATYRLMIHRFPNLYEGSYDLGDLYRRLENDSKAVVYLEEAESLSSERWEIPFSLALARMDQKRYPEAIAEIRRARTLSPKNPILLFNEAILYDQWDHKRYLPKVLDLLHRSLALDRGFADALNYLGYTEVLMKGDLVGARYMILRALTDDPKNGAYGTAWGGSTTARGIMPRPFAKSPRLCRPCLTIPRSWTIWAASSAIWRWHRKGRRTIPGAWSFCAPSFWARRTKEGETPCRTSPDSSCRGPGST